MKVFFGTLAVLLVPIFLLMWLCATVIQSAIGPLPAYGVWFGGSALWEATVALGMEKYA